MLHLPLLSPTARLSRKAENFPLAGNPWMEVKNTGDGLMVAFPSDSEAVRCAVAMQQPDAESDEREHGRALASTLRNGRKQACPSLRAPFTAALPGLSRRS